MKSFISTLSPGQKSVDVDTTVGAAPAPASAFSRTAAGNCSCSSILLAFDSNSGIESACGVAPHCQSPRFSPNWDPIASPVTISFCFSLVVFSSSTIFRKCFHDSLIIFQESTSHLIFHLQLSFSNCIKVPCVPSNMRACQAGRPRISTRSPTTKSPHRPRFS